MTAARPGTVARSRPIARRRAMGWTWALVAVALTIAVHGLTAVEALHGEVSPALVIGLHGPLPLAAVALAWTTALSLRGSWPARVGRRAALVLLAVALGAVVGMGTTSLAVQVLGAAGVGIAVLLFRGPRS